jgi:hypothetical protein
MIAAAHLPAALTIPVAAAAAVLIMWYWVRLGAEGVPRSRRRIRRASMTIMLAWLPVLVWAVSFVDYRTQQARYVVSWLLVLLGLGLILLTAVVDVLDTLRLSRQERRRHFLDAHAAAALAREARKKEEGAEA